MNSAERRQRVGRWTINAGPGAAAHARDTVSNMPGVAEGDLADALLVVSELAANAAEHGTSAAFQLEAEVIDGNFRCRVANEADASPPTGPWPMPDPDALRGRGLAIVDRLATRLDVRYTNGEAVVEADVELSTS